MPSKYTAEELRDASNKVMKSLNRVNSKATRTFDKPAILNSRGLAEGKISKSSRKRHNRKARANLAGKSMDNLLTVLPEVQEPEPVPVSAAELEEQRSSHVSKRAHHSRRAEQKLVQQEVANFGTKSLDEIKARIMKMRAPKTEEADKTQKPKDSMAADMEL